MFGINWMEKLLVLGTAGMGIAVATYFILRVFVWTKGQSKSLDYIRRHAYWTGLIAWAVSSLSAAGQAGLYHYGQMYATRDPWASIPWAALFIPAAAVIAVHAIGQATWPAPKSANN